MVLRLEINDNSPLLPTSYLLECFDYCQNNRYKREVNYKYFLKKNIRGIYFLYNKDRDVIYIGKTINCIRQRLKEHLFLSSPPLWEEIRKINFQLKKEESIFFSYIEVNEEVVDCAEVLLINKYQPKYNIQYTKKC